MYGGYGRPDPYSDYMSGGSYAPPAPSMGAQDLIGLGGLGLNAAGTVIGGYGAYRAYMDEQERAREDRRRYEDQKRRLSKQDAAEEEQRRIGNMMGFGGYAQNIDDRRRREYGGYAARVGL